MSTDDNDVSSIDALDVDPNRLNYKRLRVRRERAKRTRGLHRLPPAVVTRLNWNSASRNQPSVAVQSVRISSHSWQRTSEASRMLPELTGRLRNRASEMAFHARQLCLAKVRTKRRRCESAHRMALKKNEGQSLHVPQILTVSSEHQLNHRLLGPRTLPPCVASGHIADTWLRPLSHPFAPGRTTDKSRLMATNAKERPIRASWATSCVSALNRRELPRSGFTNRASFTLGEDRANDAL